MTFAWLIEVDTSAVCAPLYLMESSDGVRSWSRSHDRAKKFKTKEAGEEYATAHLNESVRVCEHGWG